MRAKAFLRRERPNASTSCKSVDTKHCQQVFEVLRSLGLQANQPVEFFIDGAPVLRSLTSYLSVESSHILNWFHLTMRLTVLQ